MNFKEIMESLDKLSAYELRIIANTADKLIDNPDKLILIKNYLKPGMQIDYFSSAENREINAIVREVKKSYVSVVNTHDQKCWQVHFSNINLCSEKEFSCCVFRRVVAGNSYCLSVKKGFVAS